MSSIGETAAEGVTMPQSATQGSLLRDLLGDGTDPVAVFLLAPDQDNGAFAGFAAVRGHRYCQALMKARHGESVLLQPDGLSCPAAAAAFGFRPLPPQLANGKALVGFGIVPGSRHRQAYVRWPCPGLPSGVLLPSHCARCALRRECRM